MLLSWKGEISFERLLLLLNGAYRSLIRFEGGFCWRFQPLDSWFLLSFGLWLHWPGQIFRNCEEYLILHWNLHCCEQNCTHEQWGGRCCESAGHRGTLGSRYIRNFLIWAMNRDEFQYSTAGVDRYPNKLRSCYARPCVPCSSITRALA